MASKVDNLRLVSWNVGGISTPIKRKAIISHMKKIHADIAFLQETHLNLDEAKKLKSAWVREVYAAPSSKRRKGVAILLGKRINLEILHSMADPEGRFVMLKVKIAKVKYTLCNVYAPNTMDLEFWNLFQAKVLLYSEGHLVLGGDFNMAPQCPLDRLRQSFKQQKFKRDNLESKMFKKIMQNLAIKDLWRIQNPDVQEFTCLSKAHKTLSRIDLFLIDERLSAPQVKAGIMPVYLSDHGPIFLEIQLNSLKSKPLRFIFPRFLATDLKFKRWLKDKFEEYLRFNRSYLDRPVLFWEAAKAVLRG